MPPAWFSGDGLTAAGAAAHPPSRTGGRAGWLGSARRAAIASLLLIALLYAWSRLQQPAASLHGTPLWSGLAPAFAGMTDTRGRPLDWKAERTKAVLVFFGYTYCPDVCPLTLSALAQTLAQLGPLRRDVRVVFVSLDPVRDTPAVLRAYLDAFIPGAIGLRGSLTDVARCAREWGVTWRRVDAAGGDYWIDHTVAVTLVGPRGHLRARYGYGQLTNPAWLGADLHTVLARP